MSRGFSKHDVEAIVEGRLEKQRREILTKIEKEIDEAKKRCKHLHGQIDPDELKEKLLGGEDEE